MDVIPQADRAWCFLEIEREGVSQDVFRVAQFSVGQLQEAIMIVIAGDVDAVCGATELYN